jgi:predicted HicB family RNase H-like nuclease
MSRNKGPRKNVTLRMSRYLADLVKQRAKEAKMSMNDWILRELEKQKEH